MRFSTHIWAPLKASGFCRIAWVLLCFSAINVSCGSKPKSSGQHEGASQFSTADFLRTPPEAVYVKPGSRDIVITPESNDSAGIQLIQIYSEPGAEIYFSLLGEDDLSPGKRYQTPIVMVPPFEIFAVAVKDGTRGPVRSARFGNNESINALSTRTEWNRFTESPDLNFRPGRVQAKFAAETSESERLQAIDPKGDMPSISQSSDLTAFDVVTEDEALRVRLNFAAVPVHHRNIVYGFEIGPANINPDSFGNGAEYIWRVDCNLKACRLANQKTNQDSDDHGVTVISEDSRVEIRLPKASLGDTLQSHTAIRAFAIDARRNTPILDRTLPVFLNSPFQMHRIALDGMSSDSARIELHLNETLSDSELIEEYASLAQTIGPLIEETNLYPLFNQGSTPFFVMPGSNSGFTGINSTDRGLFSALGSESSRLALIQLVAHEFAHFQNSGWSKIDSRWIQEGFSEWTAQRVMYRKLPSRAVYRFLNLLRIKPFQKLVARDEADAPLNEWNSLETNYGYEKVFAFFQILEREVGAGALIRAQLIGRNQELDTNSFQELLEKISGKELDRLFSFWVRPGPLYPEFNPKFLFADEDQDGVLAIDEAQFGTSDSIRDSNRDGFEDGENLWNPSLQRGQGPTSEGRSVVVLNEKATIANDFLRIQSTDAEVQLSPHALLTDASDFGPIGAATLLRAPFSIATKTNNSIQSFNIPAFRRDSSGSTHRIELSEASESRGILPEKPIGSISGVPNAAWSKLDSPPEIKDASSDLPDILAGLDIVSAKIQQADTELIVTIETRSDIDRHGEFGGFFLEFSRIRFDARALPTVLGNISIRTAGNENIVFDSNSLDQTKADAHPAKLRFPAKNQVEVVVPRPLVDDFFDEQANSQLCIESQSTTDSAKDIKDRAGCIQLRWSGFDLYRADLASSYGEAVHQIDLFLPSNLSKQTSDYLQLTAESGVKDFQLQLQRPLWDRYHWPIRVMFNQESEIWTDLDQNFGVFLSSVAVEDGFPQVGTAQLILEQMARLIMPDARDRIASDSQLWIREFFAVWLGMSATYSFAPTREVHEFNHDYRISHYLCFQDITCPSYSSLRINFSNERGQALNDWRQFFDNSLAQQKLLMSLTELHSLIGSKGLRQVMTHLYNVHPTSDQFLRMILGSFANLSTELNAWADRWGLRNQTYQRVQPSSVVPLFEDNSLLKLYPLQRQYLQHYFPSVTPEQYESSW
jgi:hypothetical protein